MAEIQDLSPPLERDFLEDTSSAEATSRLLSSQVPNKRFKQHTSVASSITPVLSVCLLVAQPDIDSISQQIAGGPLLYRPSGKRDTRHPASRSCVASLYRSTRTMLT